MRVPKDPRGCLKWSFGALLLLGVIGAFGVLGSSLYAKSREANRLVSLLDDTLTLAEISELSDCLTLDQIEHFVNPEQDSILLAKKSLTDARASLLAVNLPRRSPEYPNTKASVRARQVGGGSEAAAEDSFSKALRALKGVRGAAVELTMSNSSRSYFREDARPATAVIELDVVSESDFSGERNEAVVALLTRSVPGLNRGSLDLKVRCQGRNLTTQTRKASAGERFLANHSEIFRWRVIRLLNDRFGLPVKVKVELKLEKARPRSPHPPYERGASIAREWRLPESPTHGLSSSPKLVNFGSSREFP